MTYKRCSSGRAQHTSTAGCNRAATMWADPNVLTSFFLSSGAKDPDKEGLRWPDLRPGALRQRFTLEESDSRAKDLDELQALFITKIRSPATIFMSGR